jgi:hypothetical protein
MGTAHTLLAKSWLKHLKTRPDLITFVRESSFGENVHICVIKSDLLPDGDHGMQVVVKVNDDPLEIKFIRDVDT